MSAAQGKTTPRAGAVGEPTHPPATGQHDAQESPSPRWTPNVSGRSARTLRYGLVSILFLAGYLAASLLTTSFEPYRAVNPWYPLAGLGAALLLTGGPVYAPVVVLATMLSNSLIWHLEGGLLFNLLLGLAMAAGYILPVLLLQARFGARFHLRSLRQVVWFLFLYTLAPLIVAALGTSLLAGFGFHAWESLPSSLFEWWLGDTVGILTVAPLILAVILPKTDQLIHQIKAGRPASRPVQKGKQAVNWKSILETTLQVLSILLALFLAFGSHAIGIYYFSYLSFLPVIWLALRLGLRGAVVATFSINAGSMLVYSLTGAPLAEPAMQQIFMVVLAITALLLGAIISDRWQHQQNLQKSEARFRTLVESMQDIVFTLDTQQRHTALYGPWLKRSGLTPEYFLGKTPKEVMGEKDAAIHIAANRRCLSGEMVVYEWSGQVADRPSRFQTSLSPIYAADGKISGLVGVGRDITDLTRAQGELIARQRFISLLNELTRTALEQSDLHTMLQTLADNLVQLFDADSCYITEWDEEKGCTIPLVAGGSLQKSYPQDRSDMGELTMTESVLSAGHPLVAEDVHSSPHIGLNIAAKYTPISLIGLPLIANGQKLGAALIGFNQPHQFTSEEVSRGEQAAQLIALAIAKARLFASGEQRSAQLSRANTLITALGHIAAHIATANDPVVAIETLGVELKQLGMHFLFARFTTDQQHLALRHISLDRRLVAMLEKHAGLQPHEIRVALQDVPKIAQCMEAKQPMLLQNPLDVFNAAFPYFPAPVLKRSLRLLGLHEETPTVLLPLVAESQAVGLLVVWGLDLQEQDFSYLTVFASQVAIALEKARLNSDLQRLAITDPLTGLFNRRGLYELGQREVERARRYSRPLSVIMLDIDHFKLVNDRYGHPAGDEVLRVLTDRMKKNVREIDILARYGGEEFVILLPEIDLADARPVAERLRQSIGDYPISTEQGDISITISVGVSQTGNAPYEVEALIARADTAMYIAKQQGRNCVALDINGSSAYEGIVNE